jgi:hypothetical protein
MTNLSNDELLTQVQLEIEKLNRYWPIDTEDDLDGPGADMIEAEEGQYIHREDVLDAIQRVRRTL